jgi:hypothetical protein
LYSSYQIPTSENHHEYWNSTEIGGGEIQRTAIMGNSMEERITRKIEKGKAGGLGVIQKIAGKYIQERVELKGNT